MSMEIKRHFTSDQVSPQQAIRWRTFTVANFQEPVEAPESWSETAVEIAATKYFRQREKETSVRALFDRVVGAITKSGLAQGYFDHPEAKVFADELTHILLGQLGSFNSPVYFNVGIFATYGAAGTGQSFVWDEAVGGVVPISTAYVRPQASACFIQDVRDDLIGIFDLLKNEAKLFKYGSGTGTNFTSLRARGEPLEGGGESTGLISYLEIFDKAAQAIKSGGTTRRAAKMVILDADHPEILEFIQWKMHEERKARVLIANGFSGGMEGEALRTVSGQNSNNSVRVTDAFLESALAGKTWALRSPRTGQVVREVAAADLLRQMARAAWECADPGIQFHDTIQKWHTSPNEGAIRASNPCSEYLFLDNSACNLASLNLVRFLKGSLFDWSSFAQAVRILILAQDILVDYSSYPTAEIAETSHRFRPLGLGYANLGGLLMRLGIPYESEEALLWTARLTGTMHALALKASLDIAKTRGPCTGWKANREPCLQVLNRHAEAWRSRGVPDLPWVSALFAEILQRTADQGLRNMQVTLIAPTGTIGLLMDCDTLGIEPDFSLIKRKYLFGGSELVLINQAVKVALNNLGYTDAQVATLTAHVRAHGTIVGSSLLRPEHLPIFDCAMAPPGFPERRVSAEGHLKILAAAQPFLSGAISKTVNLPATATVEDIERLFLRAWRLGLKSLAIYRDGSKALQPLCAEC